MRVRWQTSPTGVGVGVVVCFLLTVLLEQLYIRDLRFFRAQCTRYWQEQPERKAGSNMAQGTVKWFDNKKGYGFITPDDGSEDLFVHHTGIAGVGFKSLDEGAKVSYEAARGRKGMQAVNVSALLAAGRQHRRVNSRVEVEAPRKDAPVREEWTPGFKSGDAVLFTETHYLTGRQATILTASPNEILVRTSIVRGKGVLYRGNAVLTVRPDQIRKLPQ